VLYEGSRLSIGKRLDEWGVVDRPDENKGLISEER